jgi:hypothetical protein
MYIVYSLSERNRKMDRKERRRTRRKPRRRWRYIIQDVKEIGTAPVV